MAQMDSVLKWILIIGLLSIAGCAATSRIPVEDHSLSTGEGYSPSIKYPVAKAVVRRSPPVAGETPDPLQEILRQIESALQQGDDSKAEVLLERALRIDSQRATLWHDLARIRYRQSSYEESVTLAQRSNRLATGKPVLQQENWSLIAQAKDALGDSSGAIQARRRAGN
ncbi:MAG: hypothetical protein H8D24_06870 [Gammaproteobacteria bacterium]|uniref:Tetratricopeptide repeat protein n=1 Tax=Candidatus Thiopontia autotrophica TaxID=2841688 RepID=A0A8J6TW41_9GAMM|nr:hypothetical protein [Candidatus Thiopontia autotrophica]MBL6969146.1 hypothetical protein [Gammaproteobacteria bacterium]